MSAHYEVRITVEQYDHESPEQALASTLEWIGSGDVVHAAVENLDTGFVHMIAGQAKTEVQP